MSWYLYLFYLTIIHELQAHLANIHLVSVAIAFFAFILAFLTIDNYLFCKILFTRALFSSVYLTALLSLTVLGRYPNSKSSINTLFITYSQAVDGNEGSIYAIWFNIVLFIPLGFIVLRYYKKAKASIFILICTPFTIELIQLITNRGVFELSDIINNFIGGLIGLGLARGFGKIIKLIKDKRKGGQVERAE